MNVGLVLKPVMTSQRNSTEGRTGSSSDSGTQKWNDKILLRIDVLWCNYYDGTILYYDVITMMYSGVFWCNYSDCVDRIWLCCMALYGPLWPCMASYGFIWVHPSGISHSPHGPHRILASSALAEFMKSKKMPCWTCKHSLKVTRKNSLKAPGKLILSSF